MKKKIIAALSIAVAAALGLSACASSGGSSSASSAADAASGTINTVLWYAPSDFDPSTVTSSPDITVARLGFDSLLRKDDDGSYIGGLATDWVANSASSYTFTLRSDATCSDGTKITPEVVSNSLQYLANSTNSSAKNWKSLIFGSGTPTFTTDDSSNTLSIDLSQPYSQLLGGMTLEASGIICPAGLADTAGLAKGTVAGAFSGPYTLTDYQAGVSVSYKLRSDYNAWPAWASVSGVPASTINITVQNDSNTTANLLKSGGLDVAPFFDANAEQFTSNSGFSYVTDNSTGNFLTFNEASSSIFANDQDLRTAVAQAVSADAFNNAAQDGLGQLMTSVTDSGFACVIDDTSLLQSYDVSAASAVLSGKTIRLVAMTNWDSAVDYVSEALKAAGANVEVTKLDPTTWKKTLRTDPTSWDMTIQAVVNSSGLVYQPLSTVLGPSFSEGGTNYTSSDNAEGVADVNAALATSDSTEQCNDLKSAQQTVLDRVDIAPLATSTHYIVARNGIQTYTFSGYWDISAMRFTS